MSGQNTPFIPPLGTPSPDSGVHPPVIQILNSSPSTQASRSRPSSRGGGGGPVGWGTPYPGSANMPLQQQQQQVPYFGQGLGTPYSGQAPFIPYSPYSQGMPSGNVGGYTPLPPVGPGGVSVDYTGYPNYLPPTPMMGGPHSGGAPPVNAPVIPPQGTPWHAGGGTVPLHHGPPGAGPPGSPAWGGMGQAATFRGWGGGGGGGMPFSAGAFPGGGWGGFATPDAGWGGMNLGPSGWGGAANSAGGWPGGPTGQMATQDPPRRYDKETGDQMSKWTAGPHYGPVLDPFQMRVVRAVLELNPLLTPVPESGPGSEKTYLRWNMLMESSLVHRSCDPLQVSWSAGRKEPATFPRLSTLKIVSEHYPWLIEVKARSPEEGVTCGEVIEAIAANMDKLTSKGDYEALSGSLKKMVLEAYRYNRSRNPDVPGGKMGDGLKRVDFLGQMTAFGGLEFESNVIGRVCGVVVPGHVVLRCDKREFMTQEEVKAQIARERAASKVPSRASRTGSRTGGRRNSRSGSISGGSSRHTPDVDVEGPSDSDDGNSTE